MPDEADRLFEEYVQALHEGRHPDRQDFLGRAGAGQPELARLMQLYDALEGVRDDVVADQAALAAERVPLGVGEVPRATVTPVPTTLGRFRDLALIGRGGLGSVYLAMDPDLKRHVALKLITAPHLDNARAAAWMLNEGRSLARLQHEGVVRVFEVGTADGRAYIAMEHVAGPSLRDVLARLREQAGRPEPGGATTPPSSTPGEPSRAAEQGLDVARARELGSTASRCELVARIAEALDYCHLNGVIHRDIKPSNVLLMGGVRPRLIDFGLAHLQSPEGTLSEITQNLLGTPAYIAPEQVHHGRTGASERSDQFSLGIVLFELLTLTNPFQRPNREQTLEAIARCDVPRVNELDPSVPGDLARICEHCLQRDPALRYARLADVAADLRAWVEQRAISLPPEAAPPAPRRRPARTLGLGVGAAVLLLAAAGGALLWQRHAAGALRDRLADVSARLAGPLDAAAATAILAELEGLQQEARAQDARLPGALLGAAAEPAVNDTIHAASRALAAALRAEHLGLVALPEGPARDAALRDVLAPWLRPLALEALLCPDCTDNRIDRERGWVDLPTAGAGDRFELQRLLPDGEVPLITRLQPVPLPEPGQPLALASGAYRLSWLRGDASWEHEFDSGWEARRRRLHPLPPTSALPAQLLPCGGGELTLRRAGGEPELRAPVSPFRILPRCVTWAELAAALGRQRCDALIAGLAALAPSAAAEPGLQPEAPAIVSGDVAQEYADTVGARLPGVLELRAALGLPGLHLGDDPLLQSEWTATPADSAARSRRVLLYSGLDVDTPWERWTEAAAVSSLRAANGFRVVLSGTP